MRRILTVSVGLFAMSLLAAPAYAEMADKAVGVWKAKSGSLVKMYKCSAGLCGKYVKAVGAGPLDSKNPDKAKQKRKVNGLTFFWAKKSGSNKWSGNLYNVRDGGTYTGSLTVKSANSINLSGCKAIIFCKTQSWSRIK